MYCLSHLADAFIQRDLQMRTCFFVNNITYKSGSSNSCCSAVCALLFWIYCVISAGYLALFNACVAAANARVSPCCGPLPFGASLRQVSGSQLKTNVRQELYYVIVYIYVTQTVLHLHGCVRKQTWSWHGLLMLAVHWATCYWPVSAKRWWMGKYRKKRKGTAQAPGHGPQQGMRPPAPLQPRPPLPQGGFRGPAPVRPMGPPGQRFPAPHRDFEPQHPRMMMVDGMEGDRGFLHEPQGFLMDDGPYHPMDFPDRREFRPRFDGPDPGFHHPEFGDRPPEPRFYHPELEYGPRFRSPEFCDRPPDFCPPEFRGRPPSFHPPEFEGGQGFHRMNPGFDQMEQYGPRDPHYMQQMDPHVSTCLSQNVLI